MIFYKHKRVRLSNDITILNIYACNRKVLKYTKQNPTELKGEIDKSTVYLETSAHSLKYLTEPVD